MRADTFQCIRQHLIKVFQSIGIPNELCHGHAEGNANRMHDTWQVFCCSRTVLHIPIQLSMQGWNRLSLVQVSQAHFGSDRSGGHIEDHRLPSLMPESRRCSFPQLISALFYHPVPWLFFSQI
ncbi:hypothetical protein [Desulfobulbus alkaliphilus]|uniref:hypothetical protein n=1 Tax=Desulfobulbus alkaliphilus TaxID=869814 RepID=UPI001963E163|nr:hypothetical protein [Desulfobulbus alkaliphilus]